MRNIPGNMRLVIASLFSGNDFFMLAMIKAGMIPGYACEWNYYACLIHRHQKAFRHPDGTPVMEPFVAITKEEYVARRVNEDTECTVGVIDGQYYRTRRVEEISGQAIRAALEARYGKDIIIVLIGGPPCQLFTSLSSKGRKSRKEDDNAAKNSRQLVFEYLRVLGELAEGGTNVVAIMEQVPDLAEKQYAHIYNELIKQAKTLPFNFASQVMSSLHHGGRQNRLRLVIQFVHKEFDIQPSFPAPDTQNVKRVKDFLPGVDHFFSGHFIDRVKTKNDFMCTVTNGSPAWLATQGVKRPPTEDELLKCFDVEPGEYLIPSGIPKIQRRQAIANAVCVSLGYALATNMIDNILRLKHIGNGYFVPKD